MPCKHTAINYTGKPWPLSSKGFIAMQPTVWLSVLP